MRLRLTLQHDHGVAIPIDYRYALSAWIYATIADSDSEFSTWLHEQGYQVGARSFKFFTYGHLQPRKFDARGGTFYLNEGPTELDLSFYIPDMVRHMVTGVFKSRDFHIGSRKRPVLFTVSNLRTLSTPEISSPLDLHFTTPLCISRSNGPNQSATYVPPDDPEFGERLFKNLRNKWFAHEGIPIDPNSKLDFDWEFALKSKYRPRLHRIKDHRVKGFTFSARLAGPPELLQMGYLGGFGNSCSALGFGFTRLV